MRCFVRWVFRDAAWWQFWLPQSGPAGGAVIGVAAMLILLVYLS